MVGVDGLHAGAPVGYVGSAVGRQVGPLVDNHAVAVNAGQVGCGSADLCRLQALIVEAGAHNPLFELGAVLSCRRAVEPDGNAVECTLQGVVNLLVGGNEHGGNELLVAHVPVVDAR